MNYFKHIALLSALLLLAACGGTTPGNPGGGGNTNTIIRVANITLTEISSVRAATAFFYSYSAAIPTPTSSAPGTGICIVTSQSPTQPTPPSPINPGGAVPTVIDGGTPLLIKSGGSTYITIDRKVEGNDIRYNGFASGPLPATATVDIPGVPGGFPAFSGVAFPSSAEFSFSATPSTRAVTKDSTFSWGSGLQNSVVAFSAAGMNASNKLVGFSCIVPDTGSFSLPAQTKTELDATGYISGTMLAAGRTTTRVEVQGNTALVLSVLRMKISGF